VTFVSIALKSFRSASVLIPLAACFANVSNSFLEAFFYKRKPFEYENEVRLLIKSKPTKNGLKRIKIKDHSFIKEIKLDPRMGKNEETAWKEHLKKRNFEVTKSHLFKEKKII